MRELILLFGVLASIALGFFSVQAVKSRKLKPLARVVVGIIVLALVVFQVHIFRKYGLDPVGWAVCMVDETPRGCDQMYNRVPRDPPPEPMPPDPASNATSPAEPRSPPPPVLPIGPPPPPATQEGRWSGTMRCLDGEYQFAIDLAYAGRENDGRLRVTGDLSYYPINRGATNVRMPMRGFLDDLSRRIELGERGGNLDSVYPRIDLRGTFATDGSSAAGYAYLGEDRCGRWQIQRGDQAPVAQTPSPRITERNERSGPQIRFHRW